MRKSLNIVLIAVLAVTSIILALPFTPLRSSFKSITGKAAEQISSTLGVDLNGKIKNARKIADSHQYEPIGLDFASTTNNGKMLNSGTAIGNNEGTYDASNLLFKQSKSNNSGNGNNIAFSASRNSNSGKNNGLLAVSTPSKGKTISPAGATVKQNGNSQNNGTGGGTHPGVDPTPPNLPIGNGVTFLFVLAITFAGFKARKLIA